MTKMTKISAIALSFFAFGTLSAQNAKSPVVKKVPGEKAATIQNTKQAIVLSPMESAKIKAVHQNKTTIQRKEEAEKKSSK